MERAHAMAGWRALNYAECRADYVSTTSTSGSLPSVAEKRTRGAL